MQKVQSSERGTVALALFMREWFDLIASNQSLSAFYNYRSPRIHTCFLQQIYNNHALFLSRSVVCLFCFKSRLAFID